MTAADRLRAIAAEATPGPWAWPHSNALAGDYRGYDSQWSLIAAIHDAGAVKDPDARLIALAPDLAAWAADAADELGFGSASRITLRMDLLARLDRITEAHTAPETPGDPQ